MEQRQVAADHHRGVQIGFHQDVGQHGGRCGFSVGAGNADGVLVGLHDLAPGLCPLKHGDAGGTGGGNLRVVVVGGSGADNAGSALNILRMVSDGNGNTLLLQFSGAVGRAHIRAGNLHPHALEHQTQRAHRNAADAHQMHVTAGCEIFGYFFILKHKKPIPRL